MQVGILAAKLGFFPRETRPDPPSLRTTVWGREFPNPIGGSTWGGCCGWEFGCVVGLKGRTTVGGRKFPSPHRLVGGCCTPSCTLL